MPKEPPSQEQMGCLLSFSQVPLTFPSCSPPHPRVASSCFLASGVLCQHPPSKQPSWVPSLRQPLERKALVALGKPRRESCPSHQGVRQTYFFCRWPARPSPPAAADSDAKAFTSGPRKRSRKESTLSSSFLPFLAHPRTTITSRAILGKKVGWLVGWLVVAQKATGKQLAVVVVFLLPG